MSIVITAENIQEEFIKACEKGNESKIKDLLTGQNSYFINVSANDYEAIKLIEKNALPLLEQILLSKVKLEGRIQKGNSYIDANTYYAVLEEETQKDKKLSLSMLINGNEYLDVIHAEVKTPAFLMKLAKSNYKKDMFDFDFQYGKEYTKFLISYISQGHSFSKKIKLTQELLSDRDFILKISQYNCNLSFVLNNHYQDDIQIMTNIAIQEKQSFSHMSAKLRNKISSHKETALKLIELSPANYLYLNKDMQLQEDCIEKVLQIKPAIYEEFLNQLKNDEIKTLKYVKTYDIDVKFLAEEVKNNREIAKVMVRKNGSNLEQFPKFREDNELVELALKTSKNYPYLKNIKELPIL